LIDVAIKLENPSSPYFYEWINQPTTKDSFTPLHLASYKGNLDAINSLLRHGANKDVLTATGLSMLHLAAQGDSAPSLFLFKEIGLDLNC